MLTSNCIHGRHKIILNVVIQMHACLHYKNIQFLWKYTKLQMYSEKEIESKIYVRGF